MRKIIFFIIFLVIIFVTNLIFYFLSDDYKFFLKKLKRSEEIVYLEEKKYDDSLILEEKIDDIIDKSEKDIVNEIFKEEEEDDEYELIKRDLIDNAEDEIVLGKTYLDIVDLFSIYELKKLEVNSNLFDLTDEYPDKYYEYYSRGLTIYFFPTRSYNEVYDIFHILEEELPFELNEINNFGDKSFYVNLDDNIKDRFIRLVISNNGIAFGLKIKKNEYSLVKAKLESLKDEIKSENVENDISENPESITSENKDLNSDTSIIEE